MNQNPNRPLPSKEELRQLVDQYLKNWENLDDYPEQESVLKKLFRKCPENKNFDEVMIKVATLNTFYSTNLRSVPKIVEQILSIQNFDMLLEDGSIWLVDKICAMEDYNPFSFATKYCSHHNPNAYPIYDSFVAKVLVEYQKRDTFTTKDITFIPKQKAPMSYEYGFYPIIEDFREYYGLTKYSFKKLDRFLWLLGKDYFSGKEEVVSYKKAMVGDYAIEITKSKSVSVIHPTKEFSSTIGALREVANLLGIEWSDKWTTQQAGRTIVKYANEHPDKIINKKIKP